MTTEQIAITAMQETLDEMDAARRNYRLDRITDESIVPVQDDEQLNALSAAQHALDNVYAAFS